MKTHSGFTLIELLVTLAIAVILTMVAVPGFRSIIQNNRASTQANELLTALTLARSEAIKRAANVSICSSANQATCAASTDWSTGWIIFTDTSGVAGVLDATDVLIRAWEPLSGNTALTTVAANNVQFLSSGLTTASTSFTLLTPECTGNNQQVIAVSATGRGHTTAAACPP